MHHDFSLKQTEIPDIQQGTNEWKKDRCGYISASRVHEMMAKGEGKSRQKYLCDLATERLTGEPRPDGFKSKRMDQGTELEPEARLLYEICYEEVNQCAFIKHPTIEWYGASPDGIIGKNGGLEIKNRDLTIHYDLLLNRKPPRTAYLQMQAQMSCCGLDWVHYASYNNTVPNNLRLVVVQVDRNQAEINVIEKYVKQFNLEINQLVNKLKEM